MIGSKWRDKEHASALRVRFVVVVVELTIQTYCVELTRRDWVWTRGLAIATSMVHLLDYW